MSPVPRPGPVAGARVRRAVLSAVLAVSEASAVGCVHCSANDPLPRRRTVRVAVERSGPAEM